jgi:hypothetical protein
LVSNLERELVRPGDKSSPVKSRNGLPLRISRPPTSC